MTKPHDAAKAHELVLIIDFGSQYTRLIARRVREAKVFCEVVDCEISIDEVRSLAPRAIILSGGPSSVHGQDAPTIDPAVFELGVPVLGICYGLQLTCHLLGGEVVPATEREYGAARIEVTRCEALFDGLEAGVPLDVWMSHGDRVHKLPEGFEVIAASEHSPFAAIANPAKHIYGLQFHPEVQHTKSGSRLLANFLFKICGLSADWTPASFVAEAVERVRQQVGETGRAVCGLSGGVDSAVAAVIVQRAIGDRLTCVFVDNGLLRKDEAQQVLTTFREHLGLNVVHADETDTFLQALSGISDPEEKRKIIGRKFIEVFDAHANRLKDVGYLVQGTIYPDVIESAGVGQKGALIKSHHNVGGLPEHMKLELVEPLRDLFKDEVRAAGRELQIPEHILGRHPFPGPGLAVRCLGEITREKLGVLREVDAVFIDELRASGWYDRTWQALAVLLPIRTVGVMGDERTYEYVASLRAVHSTDGMTADWVQLPHEVLSRMSTRIINEVRGCNRVVYDISNKPPATIEWE